MKNKLLRKLRVCIICGNRCNQAKEIHKWRRKSYNESNCTIDRSIFRCIVCNSNNFYMRYEIRNTGGICDKLIQIRVNNFYFSISDSNTLRINNYSNKTSLFKTIHCKTILEAYDIAGRYIRNINIM